MSGTSRAVPWKWPILGVSVAMVLVGYLMMPELSLDDEIGYMLRVTARVAFLFLMLAYLARPIGCFLATFLQREMGCVLGLNIDATLV